MNLALPQLPIPATRRRPITNEKKITRRIECDRVADLGYSKNWRRPLLARLALYLIPSKSALNAFANFDFSFGRCPDRNHTRHSHIADADCLQRTGPLRTTRRAREGRELEGVSDRGTGRGGGP